MKAIEQGRQTGKQTGKQEAREMLEKILKPGDTVYCQVTHVSRSGMMRRIKFHTIINNQPYFLTYNIGRLLGYTQNDQGLRVDGCGMDMCFSVVYNLGRCLFPDGFKLPPGECGRNGDTSGHDTDGGYALKYRSI